MTVTDCFVYQEPLFMVSHLSMNEWCCILAGYVVLEDHLIINHEGQEESL